MTNNKKFDFATSLILIISSLYIILECMDIYEKAKEPFYLSPALTPGILGVLLLACSLALFVNSIRQESMAAHISDLLTWFKDTVKQESTKRMFLGTVIIGIYTYFLLGELPFIPATIIFMLALMKYLQVGSWIKISLISVSTVLATYGLFQILFRVPLP